MKPGKGALIPDGHRFPTLERHRSDQADRQRQLDVAVPTFMTVDEILKEERNIALLQIAGSPQLLRHVGGYIFRPALGGIEADNANRVLVLPAQEIGYHPVEVGVLGVGLWPYSP